MERYQNDNDQKEKTTQKKCMTCSVQKNNRKELSTGSFKNRKSILKLPLWLICGSQVLSSFLRFHLHLTNQLTDNLIQTNIYESKPKIWGKNKGLVSITWE